MSKNTKQYEGWGVEIMRRDAKRKGTEDLLDATLRFTKADKRRTWDEFLADAEQNNCKRALRAKRRDRFA